MTDRLFAAIKRPSRLNLDDKGSRLPIGLYAVEPSRRFEDSEQGFVKFFGRANDRVARSMPVVDEVRRSGSHWACTYPRGKRPRKVHEGAVMFMGRLVRDPNDILIYGRAIGMRHRPIRDDASPADKKLRMWKRWWPHYIRVIDPEFIAGTLSNGISLRELAKALKSDSYASTQRNARRKFGNIDPRMAYRRLPAVELAPQGIAWLNERLEAAFLRHGMLGQSELDQLDRPAIRSDTTKGS